MKFIVFLASFFLLSHPTNAQAKGDNTVIIKGVGFLEIAEALLDAKYLIEKKDADLQTIRTEPRAYEIAWNAKYIINVRVKDSLAYLTATFTAADGKMWKDDPAVYQTNRKGAFLDQSIVGYPFARLIEFANSFKKPVSFAKR